MTIDENKKTIQTYYGALNGRDWQTIEKLFHDEFARSVDHDPTVLIQSEWKKTSTYNFFELLGFDDETLSFDFNSYTNKKEYIKNMKWLINLLIDWKINYMIAENDQVLVHRLVTVNDPQKLNLKFKAYQRFWLKDGKIIAIATGGLHLQTLLEYGSIVMKRNRSDEINHYMNSLQQWGLIPEVGPVES
ncbi:MAG: hypothetical protein ACW99A_19065 [Candidatus Kariarchaeaceae archaeon]|jgi:hypothetical protein